MPLPFLRCPCLDGVCSVQAKAKAKEATKRGEDPALASVIELSKLETKGGGGAAAGDGWEAVPPGLLDDGKSETQGEAKADGKTSGRKRRRDGADADAADAGGDAAAAAGNGKEPARKRAKRADGGASAADAAGGDAAAAGDKEGEAEEADGDDDDDDDDDDDEERGETAAAKCVNHCYLAAVRICPQSLLSAFRFFICTGTPRMRLISFIRARWSRP